MSVEEVAKQILEEIDTYPDGTYPDDAHEPIVRAILNERKRCAEKAYEVAEDAHSAGYQGSNADRIYEAIMGGEDE